MFLTLFDLSHLLMYLLLLLHLNAANQFFTALLDLFVDLLLLSLNLLFLELVLPDRLVMQLLL